MGGLVMGCSGGVTAGLVEGFVVGAWGFGLGVGSDCWGGCGVVMCCLCCSRRCGWCGGVGKKRASPEGTDSPVMTQLCDGLVVASFLFLFAFICFF